MNENVREVGVLKTLWNKDKEGNWGIGGFMPLTLKSKPGCDPDFFRFQSTLEKAFNSPVAFGSYGSLATLGDTDFLLKQSIVPVVSWVDGDTCIRCIGTGFMVSCSGYLIDPGSDVRARNHLPCGAAHHDQFSIATGHQNEFRFRDKGYSMGTFGWRGVPGFQDLVVGQINSDQCIGLL
jgi:hypothetical protein